MRSKIYLLVVMVMALTLTITLVPTLSSAEEQGWTKTITLPSGEVVCDLNGEWDGLWQDKGGWTSLGRLKSVIKITQEGNSFEGIRKVAGSPYAMEGTLAIEGELDKNGFKKVTFIYPGRNSETCKGKISKDGNKIEIISDNFYFDLKRR
jgi:hypothetical protein